MIKPFAGDYPITQRWGENPDMYKVYGLKGHNGMDFGLPTDTAVIAPNDGKIIEAIWDNSYGYYVKIENSIEGSVLAHLNNIIVSVGQSVKQGETIGYSDNTGNSTGPHLHFGYYKFPRNRQDGYNGYINQELLIEQETTPNDLVSQKVKLALNQVEVIKKTQSELSNQTESLKKFLSEIG